MKNQTVLRADQSLLVMCQRIFGKDLVVGAYVTTYDFGHSSKEEIDERLRLCSTYINELAGVLNYDSADIVLEFCNGTKVMFRNSEWASFAKVPDDMEGYTCNDIAEKRSEGCITGGT